MFTLGFEYRYLHVVPDFIIDCIFLLDIFLWFFTAYLKDVDLETRCWRITVKYLMGYFIFDVLATCPSMFSFEYKYMYWFKLFRFTRLFRFREPMNWVIWKTIGKLNIEKRILKRISSFSLLSIFLLVCVHTLSCCWILIGKKVRGSWIEVHGAQEDLTSDGNIYLAAIYWIVTTLTTVGYGDLKGYTPDEYMFQIGVEFAGIGLFAMFMGEIQEALDSQGQY